MDRITITDKDREGFTIVAASEDKSDKVKPTLDEALAKVTIEWME